MRYKFAYHWVLFLSVPPWACEMTEVYISRGHEEQFLWGALTEGKGDKNKQLESRGQEAFVFFFVFESDKSTPKVYILSTNLDGFRLGEKNMEKWTLSHILGCENIYTIVYIFIYVFIYVWDLFHLS